MYIRKTTIKKKNKGEPYYTYRIVESVRFGKKVKQRTLLNLGKDFPYPKEDWPDIVRRIESIIDGQIQLFKLPSKLEKAAQHIAACIIQSQTQPDDEQNNLSDYHSVDVNSLELLRPRSVGTENVSYKALQQLGLDKKFEELGFNKHEINAALGTIIGRMSVPGSEMSTHYWLQNQTGLGELTGYDFESISLTRMYRIVDRLYSHKEILEKQLFDQERRLFSFEETITLYDLTNTFFEGSCKYNDKAFNGKSKEKRSDCPLVTLGLVLDSSGFPKSSKVFSGNVSEPDTLDKMIESLRKPLQNESSDLFEKNKPVVVLDAGIATEENIIWLKKNGYHYIVVSRKRHREFSEDDAVTVKKDRDYTIKICKVENIETEETELYCHSSRREQKDKAIQNRFSQRFEEEIKSLDNGLRKKGYTKKYEKVVERIGRLKQKYSKAAQYYKMEIERDNTTDNATKINWKRESKQNTKDSHPGVYCLRTDLKDWNQAKLFRTYTMLTDLEAVFRSLKSELGLRPVYHQKTDRVSGHLFVTVLAYHIVQTIRYQLKEKDIHSSWSGLRKQLQGQVRITAVMRGKDGKTIHIRKSTSPEPRQEKIYEALEIEHYPGKRVKKIINENM